MERKSVIQLHSLFLSSELVVNTPYGPLKFKIKQKIEHQGNVASLVW